MNRRMTYIFSLLGFFIMWGVFGFVAAAPRDAPNLQATIQPVESTPILSGETGAAGIPVTGKPERGWTEIIGFYGLIGLAALFLILALLSFANKSTSLYAGHKHPPSEETHKN